MRGSLESGQPESDNDLVEVSVMRHGGRVCEAMQCNTLLQLNNLASERGIRRVLVQL